MEGSSRENFIIVWKKKQAILAYWQKQNKEVYFWKLISSTKICQKEHFNRIFGKSWKSMDFDPECKLKTADQF